MQIDYTREELTERLRLLKCLIANADYEAQRQSYYIERDAITRALAEDGEEQPTRCEDCAHYATCQGIIQTIKPDDACDWIPSRFKPKPTAAGKPSQAELDVEERR